MSKELEALESIIETFYDKDSEDIQIVRKALKAFEIIKNNEVDIKAFNDLENMEEYNYYCTPPLTQEEYDLLKEVLQ